MSLHYFPGISMEWRHTSPRSTTHDSRRHTRMEALKPTVLSGTQKHTAPDLKYRHNWRNFMMCTVCATVYMLCTMCYQGTCCAPCVLPRYMLCTMCVTKVHVVNHTLYHNTHVHTHICIHSDAHTDMHTYILTYIIYTMTKYIQWREYIHKH